METIISLNREKNITIVLITHYMEEAARADRVIVLDRGKVMFDDSPQRVFSHEEELLALGLDVPQSTALAHRLKQLGMDIKDTVLTPDECAAEILRNIKGKQI